jgi:hypothetical protein
MSSYLQRCSLILTLALAIGCGQRPQPAQEAPPDSTPAPVVQLPEQKPESPRFVGVRWVAGTKAEEAEFVAHLPEPIRKLYGSDPFDCFDDLGGKAWAFEYAGGPVRCWLEIEEQGQSTLPERYPPHQPDGIDQWEGKGEKGRIILWMRRNVSEKVNQVLKRVGREPEDTGVVVIGCKITSLEGGSGGAASFKNPLWYGWQKSTESRKLPEVTPLPDESPASVLELIAKEVITEGQPRQVKLIFKVQRMVGH